MTTGNLHVIIIGAGATGLAIALGLRKNEIPCTVYERNSEGTRPRDWGMLLHWATEYLHKILPDRLKERVKEIRVDPGYAYDKPVVRMDGETGEILSRTSAKNLVRVSRRKLCTLLADGLEVQYNKRLRSIEVSESDVTVFFDDGTSTIGSIVIGCDGGRSAVREVLVGKEKAQPDDTGVTMINCCEKIPYTAAQARLLRSVHPILTTASNFKTGVSSLLATLDVPDQEDPTTWQFQYFYGWYGPPYKADFQSAAEVMDRFKKRNATLCEPFYTASQTIPDSTILPLDPGQQWAPFAWDNRNGRITLAGDAAHSMVPHRGQGLNNALMDASCLVDALVAVSEHTRTLQTAIADYENEMIPRGQKEVKMSFDTAMMTVDEKSRKAYMSNYSLDRNATMGESGHVVAQSSS